MRNEDLLALMALTGGLAAFKKKADKDSAALPERKRANPFSDVDVSGSKFKQEIDKIENKQYKKGGKVSSASSRADGCAQRGKTKGRMI
jgi:hypothetical protein